MLTEMFMYDRTDGIIRPVWVYDTQTFGRLHRLNMATGQILYSSRKIKVGPDQTDRWVNEELLFTTRKQCEAAQRRPKMVLKDFAELRDTYDKPSSQQPDPKHHEPKTPTQIAVRNLLQQELIKGVNTGLFTTYQILPDPAKLIAEALVDTLADHNYKLMKILPVDPACCDTIETQINSLPKSQAVERTEADAAKARTQPHGPTAEPCTVCGGERSIYFAMRQPDGRCYTCWDADNKPLENPHYIGATGVFRMAADEVVDPWSLKAGDLVHFKEGTITKVERGASVALKPSEFEPELFSVFYSLALGDCVFRSSDGKYTPCLNHNHAIQVKKALELRPERIHEHFWYSPSEKPEIAK